MFWKIIFLGLFLYILYRFVFGFILPVYKTTQKIKKGFRDMQQQANEKMRQQEGHQQANTAAASNKKDQKPLGEYIEFEDVK